MLFLPPAEVAEAPTPAPLELDLNKALSRAKADNPMIRVAKARVEERQGLITSTRADALPQVTLVGDFTRIRDVSILNSNMGSGLAAWGLDPNENRYGESIDNIGFHPNFIIESPF